MQARLVAAVANTVTAWDDGKKVNVRALSAELGITPKTFYKWAGRFQEEGLDGLAERSRRPERSPTRVAVTVENAIVEWRKRLGGDGLDAGAASIHWHMDRDGRVTPPSEATIWRVLVRRGFVVPEPRKRPKAACRRFEAPAPNEWWQIDATEWVLADRRHTVAKIFNIIDDHSRLCVDSLAVMSATTELAWAAFCRGTERYGLPGGCLSDNGSCFSGKLRGYEAFFEAQLRGAGVRPITSRPYHPQTCGKVERFQQTLKKWLRVRQTKIKSLAALQDHLDEFRGYYNEQRPHRAIGRRTPWERFNAQPLPKPARPALPPPQRWTEATVSSGQIGVKTNTFIGLGKRYNGKRAKVLLIDNHAIIFIDDRIVRELDMQPGFNPTGQGSSRKPPKPGC
jgi:transposase InsO family protein